MPAPAAWSNRAVPSAIVARSASALGGASRRPRTRCMIGSPHTRVTPGAGMRPAMLAGLASVTDSARTRAVGRSCLPTLRPASPPGSLNARRRGGAGDVSRRTTAVAGGRWMARVESAARSSDSGRSAKSPGGSPPVSEARRARAAVAGGVPTTSAACARTTGSVCAAGTGAAPGCAGLEMFGSSTGAEA